MSIELFVLWGLVGWCGTPPRPWPWPRPRPDPIPWTIKVIGIVGGLIGGWAFNASLVSGGVVTEGMTGINAAATAVGAYVGSVFLADMYNFFRGAKPE